MRTAEGRSILLLFNIEIIIVHSPRLSQLHCLWDTNVLLFTFIRRIDPFIIWNSWNRIIFTTAYQPYFSPLIFSLTTNTVFGSAFSFWTYNSVRKTLLANYISTIALAFSKKKKRLVFLYIPASHQRTPERTSYDMLRKVSFTEYTVRRPYGGAWWRREK